jgi:hypothetical protein
MNLFFATLGSVLLVLAFLFFLFGLYFFLTSPYSWTRCENKYKLDVDHQLPEAMHTVALHSRPYLLREDTHKDMCNLLHDSLELFVKLGIEAWAVRSTALGAIRHQGFVPWCDRIELGIRLEHLAALVAARPEFEAMNLSVAQHTHGYTISYNRSVAFPCIDVLIFKLRQGKYDLATPFNELGVPTFDDVTKWPHESLRQEDIFDKEGELRFIHDFEGYSVLSLPQHVEIYLSNVYGADWASEIETVKWQHLNNRRTEAVLHDLF